MGIIAPVRFALTLQIKVLFSLPRHSHFCALVLTSLFFSSLFSSFFFLLLPDRSLPTIPNAVLGGVTVSPFSLPTIIAAPLQLHHNRSVVMFLAVC